jgi:hypothetical protein
LRTARCDGGVARPLHAEDHSPPPRGRKRANAGTNRIRTRPSSSGLPYLASVGCRFAARSTIARSVDPLGREREAERRSRGSGLLVTPSRSTQRLHADRSAHVCPLCVRAIRRSTSTTCTGPPGIRGVYRCIAPNGLLRTGDYRLERGETGSCWRSLKIVERRWRLRNCWVRATSCSLVVADRQRQFADFLRTSCGLT